MIDPMLSLAFAVWGGKGVYAPLLGSGISRAAHIPTGWEVVEDLIRRLGRASGADCGSDPAAWYRETMQEEPDYSRLLAQLGKFPAERRQLLQGYFDPTEEERERGEKVPTAAHHAIAELVAQGYVRVILTTNFDRLMEQALAAKGVVPIVISTPDAAEGAPPLVHSPCTVVKLHGDYLDARILNTSEGLARYDDRMDRLLDRVLDEYGLIVCGWSGDWDAALRAAIYRCRGRRYTTYWTYLGTPSAEARRVIEFRGAETIAIAGADQFFASLTERVLALQEYSRPHPLSAKLAVATLKRYLEDARYDIRLHDLIADAVGRLGLDIAEANFPVGNVPYSDKELERRLRRYEVTVDIPLALFATGCYWSGERHDRLWVQGLERTANPRVGLSGMAVWIDLRLYPALLLLYGGGIAALAGEQYSRLLRMMTKPEVRDGIQPGPAALALYPNAVLHQGAAQRLPGMQGHYTPLSEHLHAILREPLRDLIPDDVHYDACFDRFEYLLALTHASLRQRAGDSPKGPIGRFAWKNRRIPGQRVMDVIDADLAEHGEEWPPLRAGLCGGSLEMLRVIKASLDQQILELPWS